MTAFHQIINNKIIQTAVLSWLIAQIIKIIIDCIKNKTINPALIVSSGGMPSSHSSFVTSLACATGFTEGFGSTLFAITFVISMVVMYDASGVRRAAGKQAEVLNIFIANFEKHGVKIDSKLKELLGHSPVEVFAGAILGIVVAIITY
ncbi:divergent PAP2 family protein [uncultured Tyzzerella sp.]|uniref:divergent PAP2 family protein n=1 Tax=uncultured Tyzzerella sp. TaxID=2321398 RepID=UPI0029428B52|nr:divergent PAP2 family protein [uncultured Tyzzerella sp.]